MGKTRKPVITYETKLKRDQIIAIDRGNDETRRDETRRDTRREEQNRDTIEQLEENVFVAFLFKNVRGFVDDAIDETFFDQLNSVCFLHSSHLFLLSLDFLQTR
jgi:hypothetical protein